MTRKKSVPLPRDVPEKTNPTLEQLMNAGRPLMFSRMPRMLRGDGTMAGTLDHQFRYFEDIQTHPVPVSVRRWEVALQMSRILRDQRRRASHAH